MRRPGRQVALLVGLCALLAGCKAAVTAAPPGPADPYPALYRTLRPSLVLFTMEIPSDDPKHKGDWDDAYGSGVVVGSGPWGTQILTNQHVIDGARRLRARIGDHRTYAARVIAADRDQDLALVQVDAKNQRAARLGTSREVAPGQSVGVMGYPIPDAFEDEGLGTAASIYAGRVSAILKDALELDLPIIPGESGGPVFEADDGAVVGIAQSRFEEERAIGFAIPVDIAKHFLVAHHARLAPVPSPSPVGR